MDRRSSLIGAADALGEFFGRRSSGFGDGRRASGFGDLDSIFSRRDSLDSTTAVLDAAIMDLTRRRLSMVVSGDPLQGAAAAAAAMNPMGAGMNNSAAVGGGLNNLNGGLNAMAATSAAGPMNSFGAVNSSSVNQTNHLMMGSAPVASGACLPNRHKSIEEQQRELDRRQKELEIQRQQLIAGMEERRLAMQKMQEQMHTWNGPGSVSAASAQQSVLASQLSGAGASSSSNKGGAPVILGGHNSNLSANSSNARKQWWVCQICNAKAFSSREEASKHEAECKDGVDTDALVGNISNNSPAVLEQLRQSDNDNRQKFDRDKGHGGVILGPSHSVLNLAANRRFSLNFHGANSISQSAAMGPSALANALSSTSNPNGPFQAMTEPLPLSMPSDKDWLTPLHCFVRRHCVQVFTASKKDVATPSKGKRKPIQVGQVGIRCPHCHHDESAKARERGSVYYPTTIASIYNATMNLLQRHLHNCSAVPADIMQRYETLKADDARSGTSKKYWVESALRLGLVDTPIGIRYSQQQATSPPPLSNQHHTAGMYSNSNDFFSSHDETMSDMPHHSDVSDEFKSENNDLPASNNTEELSLSQADSHSDKKLMAPNESEAQNPVSEPEKNMPQPASLVTAADEPFSTAFSYHLLSQMQPCVFTEADRLGKRKGLPPGFPGLACRHCFGGYGSGRFFPSSIKTLSDTSKTLNVLHNHMTRCRKCPQAVRDTLDKLRLTHDEERAKMKFGSQKAFFARIWDRLHNSSSSDTGGTKRKLQQTTRAALPTMATRPFMMGSLATSNGAGFNALQQQQQQNKFANPGYGLGEEVSSDQKRLRTG